MRAVWLLGALSLGAFATGALLLAEHDADAAPPPQPRVAATDAAVAAAPPLATAFPQTIEQHEANANPAGDPRLWLPDGSSVPALNGAVDAPPLARGWDPTVPWAPIVGVRTVDGVQWYVHADGTQSTTRMVMRPDLGRLDAVTSVAHPGHGPAPAVRKGVASRFPTDRPEQVHAKGAPDHVR